MSPDLRESAGLLPETPGVYRFVDPQGRILYVGKAKNLKRRVTSYFQNRALPARIGLMLRLARALETTECASENQALLLEAFLIKKERPRFNVLLKDDKSYPFIHLDTSHPFPSLSLYRGSTTGKPGLFFGPFPSSRAVRETLRWMKRILPVRQCPETRFKNRVRPCLEYQIKRCSGPCCGRVEEGVYREWVRDATLFLNGGEKRLVARLRREMTEAAKERRFEEAARLRDRLRAIEQVREQFGLGLPPDANLDVLAAWVGEEAAVSLLAVRNGLKLEETVFFPENGAGQGEEEVLAAFLAQYYVGRPPPVRVLVTPPLEEGAWIAQALSESHGAPVAVEPPRSAAERRLTERGVAFARESLARRLLAAGKDRLAREELARDLGLPRPPQRLEAVDLSHLSGQEAVGAIVVFGEEGFESGGYRRYTVRDASAVDDTRRMAEVLARRFARRQEEPLPELMILDGGLPQLHAALAVAREHGIDPGLFVALAKGRERRPGTERLFLPGREECLILPEGSQGFMLLQRVRDEAHRFAVSHQRLRREKSITASPLDEIPGLGPKRKQALLRHFGATATLAQAPVEEVMAAARLPRELALRILATLSSS